MHDPRPVRLLCLLYIFALCLLAVWWTWQDEGTRQALLFAIWHAEQATTLPPSGAPYAFLDQGQWLILHRWRHLQGMALLGATALLIGVCEGSWHRARDPLGGFRLTRWTVGVLGLALSVGLVAAYLCAPIPLPLGWCAGGFAGLLGLVGYALAHGRPYIS